MGANHDGQMLDLLFGRFGEVVTSTDARRLAMPADLMRRSGRRGDTVRVAKAAFVRTETWRTADAWNRFRLRSIGFVLAAAEQVFLTEAAAQIIHGLPHLHPPPPLPVAIRPGDAHRGPDRTVYGRVRTGHLPPHHRTLRQRARVVDLAYAAVDVARHTDPAEALMVIDHALRHGADRGRLARLTQQMENYPGIGLAAWAIVHGDPRSESALESLGRLAFLEADRPVPLSNVWIDDGLRAVRVDHLLPESGVVLEADGALKVNNRPDAVKVVNDQLDRERFLRRLGYAVERYDFPTAAGRRGEIVYRATRAAMERGNRPAPTSWSLEPPERLRGWSGIRLTGA